VLAPQVELAAQQHTHTESVHEHSTRQQHLREVEPVVLQQLLRLQSEIASHKTELAGHEEKTRQQHSMYTECVQEHNRTLDQLQHTHKQDREQLLDLQRDIETHKQQLCQQQTVHTASQHKHTSQREMREKDRRHGSPISASNPGKHFVSYTGEHACRSLSVMMGSDGDVRCKCVPLHAIVCSCVICAHTPAHFGLLWHRAPTSWVLAIHTDKRKKSFAAQSVRTLRLWRTMRLQQVFSMHIYII